jgi:hypothetical protein
MYEAESQRGQAICQVGGLGKCEIYDRERTYGQVAALNSFDRLKLLRCRGCGFVFIVLVYSHSPSQHNLTVATRTVPFRVHDLLALKRNPLCYFLPQPDLRRDLWRLLRRHFFYRHVSQSLEQAQTKANLGTAVGTTHSLRIS